jgi:hypothetical protein
MHSGKKNSKNGSRVRILPVSYRNRIGKPTLGNPHESIRDQLANSQVL